MPQLSNRSSHPPITGGGSGNSSVSLSSSTSTYHASSLPPSKPPVSSSSSSYQSGTKFHSSSSAVSSVEHVKGASSSLSSAQDQDITATVEPSSTSSSSAPSFVRHRIHRRKDQDTKVASGNNHTLPAIKESLPASGSSGSNSNCGSSRSSGVQFDLEAAAFPPLPGLDTDHGKASTDVGSSSSAGVVGMESSQNRLSDVVKGTAKLKAIVKDKENGNQPQPQLQQQQQPTASAPAAVNTVSRSASPGASTGAEVQGSAVASTNSANVTHILNPPTTNNENTSSADAAALSTVALTPPSSPDK